MYRYLTLLPVPLVSDGTIYGKGDPNSNIYWDIQLDPDLLQTLINIYPEWFQDYNLDLMGEEGINFPLLNQDNKPLDSSPKAQVDDASIRNSMDKNKESLKLKLMLRRPIHQLVEQGIIPSPKQSPGFYEQSKKLERARMEDFLKHKIQRRPDRQVLIQQHILEDTTVSPTIHNKQRQLKKARLTDDLNDRLSHRPGPLELVKGNILLTDGRFAQAVKEGQIQFKATSEGEPIKHPPPRFIIESQEETSSDDAASPSQSRQSEKSLDFTSSESGPPSIQANVEGSVTNTNNKGNTISLTQVTNLIQPTATTNLETQTFALGTLNCIPITSTSATSTLSQVFPAFTSVNTTSTSNQCQLAGNAAVASPSSSVSNSTTSSCSQGASGKESTPILTKNRKKSKSKSQPKTKTIKFHEYKGPPSAQKNQSSSNNATETSYELLLKQQQLFLQWQLEWQQKYPQIILPSAQKNNMDQGSGSNSQVSNNNNNNNNSGSSSSSNNNNQANPVAPIIITSPSRPQNNMVNNANQNSAATNSCNNISSINNTIGNNAGSNGTNVNGNTVKMILKLEDMKVSDLKCELKKRNLPVSGSKPQLLERLKPFIECPVPTLNPSGKNVVPSNDGSAPKQSLGFGNITDLTANGKGEEPTPMSPNMPVDRPIGEPDTESGNIVCKSSPSSTPMELDSNCNNMADANEGIQQIQHKNEEDLKREIQQRQQQQHQQQFQLQFQNQPVFANPTQSVTIPLSALTSPQIQIVTTSSAPMTDVSCNDPKSLQKQLLQQNQHKITNQTSNQSPNLAAIISPGNASAAVKANLAAFLHQHAQQQQAQQQALQQQQIQIQQQRFQAQIQSQAQQSVNLINSIPVAEIPRNDTTFDQASLLLGKVCDAQYPSDNNFTTSEADNGSKYHFAIKQSTFSLPLITTQVIDSKSFPTFQQVLLYPSSMNPSPAPQTKIQPSPMPTSNVGRSKQTRTNSLPTELPAKTVTQRASSLSDFSTLVHVKSEPCLGEVKAEEGNTNQVKPPPAYEEATKETCQSKETRKFIQNQAIDDVIEILMKNGDLPLSMRMNTESQPKETEAEEKLNSGVLNSSSMFMTASSAEPNMECLAKETSEETNDIEKMDDAPDQLKSQTKDVEDHDIVMDSGRKDRDEANKSCNNHSNYDVTSGDLLFNEFMDFQGSPMNVDYANWLAEIMPENNPFKSTSQASSSYSPSYTTINNNYNNKLDSSHSESSKNHHSLSNGSMKSSELRPFNNSGSFSSSSSSSSTSTDHDPVLANNMVESCHYGDPLIDLYFDMESDCKETNDLVNLVWDKVDFAT